MTVESEWLPQEESSWESHPSPSPLTALFDLAAGSVRGRDHELAGKNNQDAFGSFATDKLIAIAACDGCGSAKHSEVGAKLGCRLLLEALRRRAGTVEPLGVEWVSVLEEIRLDMIAHLLKAIDAMGGSRSRTVSDYFLFTIVGAAITSNLAVIFSIGDGVIFINGERIMIGPFPGNQPPYLAYGGLVDSALLDESPDLAKFQVHRIMPATDVREILVGTDGADDLIREEETPLPGRADLLGPISQFWNDDRYFANPDMIRRKLFLANREAAWWDENAGRMMKKGGILKDDTTIVVARRRRTA